MNFNEPKTLASTQVENQEQGDKMETRHTPIPLTAKSWHVNTILNGRIAGDETAEKFDKIHINGENRTIAVVFRPNDAREIANNHNSHAALTSALDGCVESVAIVCNAIETCIKQDGEHSPRLYLDELRAALEQAKKARGT